MKTGAKAKARAKAKAKAKVDTARARAVSVGASPPGPRAANRGAPGSLRGGAEARRRAEFQSGFQEAETWRRARDAAGGFL